LEHQNIQISGAVMLILQCKVWDSYSSIS